MDNIYIFDIVFVILLLSLIILFFIYRYDIFKFNSEDFGKFIYETSECLSTTGKCNQVGKTTEIKKCIRNPITKKGCLNENIQVMKSEVKSISCVPMCKSSIWQIKDVSPCVLGIKTTIEECISWDAFGVNTCTYPYMSNSTGCEMSVDGFTMICGVSSLLTVTEKCEI